MRGFAKESNHYFYFLKMYSCLPCLPWEHAQNTALMEEGTWLAIYSRQLACKALDIHPHSKLPPCSLLAKSQDSKAKCHRLPYIRHGLSDTDIHVGYGDVLGRCGTRFETSILPRLKFRARDKQKPVRACATEKYSIYVLC